ncbi:MAG: right-handed parallel beta-helix repeat-containing protein [Anaerolineae bacterium]
MRLQSLVQVMLAVLIAIGAGVIVRDTSTDIQADTCTRSALDAVLGGGVLELAPDCVLVVSPAAVVTGEVTIRGGMLHSNGVDRVLIVEASARLTLQHVTILSGAVELDPAYGGAIYNAGFLHVDHSAIRANSAEQGGGIYNAESGRVIVTHSELARNRAREGGAIYNEGVLVLADSVIDDNSARRRADYGGYGAGIVNRGRALIVRTRITDNQGDLEGIGIDNSGWLWMRNSIIAGNRCLSGDSCRGVGVLRFGGTVDIRQNYWGSADGPGGDGDGSGDSISGVRARHYLPYLTDLPEWAR